MTLQQYLSQDPVIKQLQGSVLLEPTDCQVSVRIMNSEGIYPVHLIEVHIFKYPHSSYRVDLGSGTLYTQDEDGNIKKATVFKIDISKLNSYK